MTDLEAPVKPLKIPLKFMAVCGGLLLSTCLRADVQSSVNVLASALASSESLQAEQLAIGNFSERGSGQAGPFSQALKNALRKALGRSDRFTLLKDSEGAAGADAVLGGSYALEGGKIHVEAELHDAKDDALLWSRGADIDAAGLDTSEFSSPELASQAAPPLDGPEHEVVPRFPPRPPRKHHPFRLDLGMGYKAFFPVNSSFQSSVGTRLDAFSLGLSLNDIFLVDADIWSKDVSGLGSVQSVDYLGLNTAVVFPWHLGEALTLYAGPGLRFGSVGVNDPSNSSGGAAFGNNGLVAVAGLKAKAGRIGLDLRYSYDLLSSYTGYSTARLGAFYEFGH